jgi:hypothetical protein
MKLKNSAEEVTINSNELLLTRVKEFYSELSRSRQQRQYEPKEIYRVLWKRT